MKYYVYKYVENNKIVYIGQTTDLERRIKEHKSDQLNNFKGKIYYFICNNKTEMDSYEYFLIQKYAPKFNKQYKPNIAVNNNIAEPKWQEYNKMQPEKKHILQIKNISITEEEEYITIKDFAKRQGISMQAVYKSIKKGPTGKYYKFVRLNEFGQYEISTKGLNTKPKIEDKNNISSVIENDKKDLQIQLLQNELEFQKKQNEILQQLLK